MYFSLQTLLFVGLALFVVIAGGISYRVIKRSYQFRKLNKAYLSINLSAYPDLNSPVEGVVSFVDLLFDSGWTYEDFMYAFMGNRPYRPDIDNLYKSAWECVESRGEEILSKLRGLLSPMDITKNSIVLQNLDHHFEDLAVVYFWNRNSYKGFGTNADGLEFTREMIEDLSESLYRQRAQWRLRRLKNEGSVEFQVNFHEEFSELELDIKKAGGMRFIGFSDQALTDLKKAHANHFEDLTRVA